MEINPFIEIEKFQEELYKAADYGQGKYKNLTCVEVHRLIDWSYKFNCAVGGSKTWNKVNKMWQKMDKKGYVPAKLTNYMFDAIKKNTKKLE